MDNNQISNKTPYVVVLTQTKIVIVYPYNNNTSRLTYDITYDELDKVSTKYNLNMGINDVYDDDIIEGIKTMLSNDK